jgi:uncharacterized protein
VATDGTDYSALKAFLSNPARPAGTLQYHELQGFFFTIACCPDLVRPPEWLPFIFADREAGYHSLEEANQILGELMRVYNTVVGLARSEPAQMPDDCVVRRVALANLADDAPLAQWSRGFLHGHQWLEESWDPYLSDELEEEFGAVLMTLTFFASPSLAQAYADESDGNVSKLAATMKKLFRQAVDEYAHLGRTIQQVIAESAPGPGGSPVVAKPGRNERCPCGSGKKWKKCCGAVNS